MAEGLIRISGYRHCAQVLQSRSGSLSTARQRS